MPNTGKKRLVDIKAPQVAAFQAEGNRIAALRLYDIAFIEAELFDRAERDYFGPAVSMPSVWHRRWTLETAPAWGCYLAAVQLGAESAEVFLKVLWSDRGKNPVDRSHDLGELWDKVDPKVRGLVSADAGISQAKVREELAALRDVHTTGRYLGEYQLLEIGQFRADEFFAVLSALSNAAQSILPEFKTCQRPAMKDCLNCTRRMDWLDISCPGCGTKVWNDIVPWWEYGKSQPITVQ